MVGCQTLQRLPILIILEPVLMRSVSGHDTYREDQTLQRLPILIILEPEVYGTKWMARGVRRTHEPMVDIKFCVVYGTKWIARGVRRTREPMRLKTQMYL